MFDFTIRNRFAAWLVFAVLMPTPVWAQKTASEGRKAASKPHAAAVAIRRFVMADGIEANVFAADPQVANPVAFCFDERGRMFVCETYRQGKGVEDNRDHEGWIDDDLAAQTVDDRLAYFQKHLGADINDYTLHEDRLRLLVDQDGDGQADSSTIFRDGFNGVLEGTGAGVLARKGAIYYACIPRLWAFRDSNDDGRADREIVLHEGFGVRVAFRGHDLHGLCLGPDGRIYFSIGDRGFHVRVGKEEKTLANPETGAIFRCEQNGDGLEVFASGLRNPQELAFDEFGNLFTGENNSDSGDLARWVHVLEGGDCGWRMAFQYLPDRGPWNRQKLWLPYHEGQPAYIVPPIANIGDGPAGIAYYPGTGLAEHFRGNFFMCDFRGEAGQSGVRTFKLRPRGATFELFDREIFLWNCLATDVGFGPDGNVYVADWVEGWDGVNKGRIYRLRDPRTQMDTTVDDVKTVLAAGMQKRDAQELRKLLEHPDYRVRLEAQLELALRGKFEVLRTAVDESQSPLARLHGIWGLGQITRRKPDSAAAAQALLANLRDVDPMIRAAAANMLGDAVYQRAAQPLAGLLNDNEQRVQYFAAISLGKLKAARAAEDLMDFAAIIPADDFALRHASAMGLAGCATAAQLRKATTHPAKTARIAALLALRRQQSEAVVDFLDDADPYVVTEAALAIHDVPIRAAFPALAAAASKRVDSEPFLRRALNANFHLGGEKEAQRLAEFAADTKRPVKMRMLALGMLGSWSKPPSRDLVLGMWRPLPERDDDIPRSALQANLPKLLRGGLAVRTMSARLAGTLGVGDAGPLLTELLWNRDVPAAERAGVLLALANIDPDDLQMTVARALQDDEPRVRAAARIVMTQTQPDTVLATLESAIQKGKPIEQKSAMTLLARLGTEPSDAIIAEQMQRLVDDTLPAYMRVEALATAQRRRENKEIEALIKEYEEGVARGDELARYRIALEGGQADRGAQIFAERLALSCVRCHKINGVGGEVGPDLSHIGKDKSREYLLESIVTPGKTVAKDFEAVVLFTDDGRSVTGVVKSEDENDLYLMDKDGHTFQVNKDTIEGRETGKSAMPDDLIKYLTLFDLRDLIEYLASLD